MSKCSKSLSQQDTIDLILPNYHFRALGRGGLRQVLDFSDDPGLTEQSHRDSTDINIILKHYETTGTVPVTLGSIPKHGDFSHVPDYQTALNLVIAADEAFDNLPANIRKEYDNDPALFLSAIENPSERAKLIDLGVIVDESKVDVDQSSSLPLAPVKASKGSESHS